MPLTRSQVNDFIEYCIQSHHAMNKEWDFSCLLLGFRVMNFLTKNGFFLGWISAFEISRSSYEDTFDSWLIAIFCFGMLLLIAEYSWTACLHLGGSRRDFDVSLSYFVVSDWLKNADASTKSVRVLLLKLLTFAFYPSF